MEKDKRPLFAALFDADNIPAKHARAILDEITNHGEPVLRRVYGDWSSERMKNWTTPVRDLGMIAHQQTANTTGKNASDIGMVIDAMDMLHSGRFDGFALVSSDSDFTALANRLREEGLTVLGIGEEKTPDALRNACTQFVRIEDISGPGPSDKSAKKSQKQMKQAEDRLLNVLDPISDDDGWASLSEVGARVRAKYPDFDPRSYGFAKLSDLIKGSKRFETRRDGTSPMFRARKT